MYTTFKLNNDADSCGTWLCGEVVANYSELAEVFGHAQMADGYKISGEWIFESEDGDIVTLYDWKETCLYDSDYPSVSDFRNSCGANFHIGANSKEVAKQFTVWLTAQLESK